jgi:hypothetical protein
LPKVSIMNWPLPGRETTRPPSAMARLEDKAGEVASGGFASERGGGMERAGLLVAVEDERPRNGGCRPLPGLLEGVEGDHKAFMSTQPGPVMVRPSPLRAKERNDEALVMDGVEVAAQEQRGARHTRRRDERGRHGALRQSPSKRGPRDRPWARSAQYAEAFEAGVWNQLAKVVEARARAGPVGVSTA